MTNECEQGCGLDPVLCIDEAKYLLSGHPAHDRLPTADEMANGVVDLIQTYAEVPLTPEQRSEVARIVRSLPDDDASMDRFVKNCEANASLAPLVSSLKLRVEGPWRLL